MTAIIPNHQHCRVCGRAMKFGDEKVCSPECKKEVDVVAKKRRNLLMFIYGITGALALLFLLQAMGIL